MNEAELSPIARENMGGFVMMKADLNTIPATYDPKIGKLKPEQLHKPFNDASRCIAGMGQLIALSGGSSEAAMKAAATFQLISAGVEISAGFQMLFEVLTVAKGAEGAAQLGKWTVGAPIIAALAIAGTIAFVALMESREYNFSGDYSGSSGQRKLQADIAKEGLRSQT